MVPDGPSDRSKILWACASLPPLVILAWAIWPHPSLRGRALSILRLKKEKKGEGALVWNLLVEEARCVYVSHVCDMETKLKVKVAQWCPTLCDPMDYTVRGILQASIPAVGSYSLLRGIFPTQGLNPGFPHCRQILYQLNHKGNISALAIVNSASMNIRVNVSFSVMVLTSHWWMTITKKFTNSKCWRGCGEKGTLLHCLCEWKLIQLLWRRAWKWKWK